MSETAGPCIQHMNVGRQFIVQAYAPNVLRSIPNATRRPRRPPHDAQPCSPLYRDHLEMGPLTFPYKFVDDKPSYVDLYLPDVKHTTRKTLPVVLYFHGGGVTVGNRRSWFPNWIHSVSPSISDISQLLNPLQNAPC